MALMIVLGILITVAGLMTYVIRKAFKDLK